MNAARKLSDNVIEIPETNSQLRIRILREELARLESYKGTPLEAWAEGLAVTIREALAVNINQI